MPTYEYKCKQCGSMMEIFATITQKDKGLDISCNVCGSRELQQKFGAAYMKGAGDKSYNPSPSGNPGGCSSCSGGNCSTC